MPTVQSEATFARELHERVRREFPEVSPYEIFGLTRVY